MTADERDQRLRELILYVAERSEDDPKFGATKLNKILFYADFIAFGQTGSAITEQEYQRLDRGPAPRRLLPIRKRLIDQSEAAIQHRERYGFVQDRLVALRDPDLSGFTGEQIAIVNDVIDYFQDMDAAEVSAFSHSYVGWEIVENGETIPYETVFISKRPLTQEETAYGAQLAQELAAAGTDGA